MSKCSVGYPAGLECAAAANHFSEDWFAEENGGGVEIEKVKPLKKERNLTKGPTPIRERF